MQISDATDRTLLPVSGRDSGQSQRADHANRRRAELLEAARQVVLDRGMASTRVQDIAKATNVSGGLIHYHFASKDELMAEMLRVSSEIERRQLKEFVEGPGTALHRLDRVIQHYIPLTRDDQSWILWIESWAAGLRAPHVRQILGELEEAWVGALEACIRAGVAAGEFQCDDPHGAAERLDALLDGIIVRCTLRPNDFALGPLLEHGRIAAAHELGLPRSAFPA